MGNMTRYKQYSELLGQDDGVTGWRLQMMIHAAASLDDATDEICGCDEGNRELARDGDVRKCPILYEPAKSWYSKL